jgi:hypothetical protein
MSGHVADVERMSLKRACPEIPPVFMQGGWSGDMYACSTTTGCGGECSLRVELFGDVEYAC